MIRALQLEWLKVRHYRIFWVLAIMYCLALLIGSSVGKVLLDFLESKGADFEGITPSIIPIYDFPDIWQNITWIVNVFKILPALVIIISVTNDISFRTMRQNVIDGFSKREYMYSKLIFIVFLALLSAAVIFVIGLIMGFNYSSVTSPKYVFRSIEFLGSYFLSITAYCCFAWWLAVWIKKTGFIIAFLIMYTFIFEPIMTVNFLHNPYVNDPMQYFVPYFPVYAMNSLIPLPYGRYIFMEVQNYLTFKDIAIALGWLGLTLGLIYRSLLKKDMR